MKAAQRILIVDDEPFNTCWLIDYLNERGHRVDWAKYISDAKALIGSEMPGYSIAILDVMMPAPTDAAAHAAGIELVLRLREQRWGRRTKIIVYTALKRDEFNRRAREMKVNPGSVAFFSRHTEDEEELMRYLEEKCDV